MDVENLMNRGRAECAADTIEAHFVKAIADLQMIEHALASELEATYAKNINPYNLLNRIKQLGAELPLLTKECQQLTAAKQDLIDTAKRILVQNRTSVRRMEARAGLTVPSDSEDSVYTGFKQILAEWNQGIQASIILHSSLQCSPSVNSIFALYFLKSSSATAKLQAKGTMFLDFLSGSLDALLSGLLVQPINDWPGEFICYDEWSTLSFIQFNPSFVHSWTLWERKVFLSSLSLFQHPWKLLGTSAGDASTNIGHVLAKHDLNLTVFQSKAGAHDV